MIEPKGPDVSTLAEPQKSEYHSLSPLMKTHADVIGAMGLIYLNAWLTGRISMREELELKRIDREIANRK